MDKGCKQPRTYEKKKGNKTITVNATEEPAVGEDYDVLGDTSVALSMKRFKELNKKIEYLTFQLNGKKDRKDFV